MSRFQRQAKSRQPRPWDSGASFEESFRVLRSNLLVAVADIDHRSVVVTSPNAGEGKTLTCANLAVSVARAGQRVVVVDMDLRHPNLHRVLSGHNDWGVCDVLLGRRRLEESLQYVELPGTSTSARAGLYVLATGADVANPTELIGMGRTARLLDSLSRQADIVLIDTPPVLPVADTLVIGRIASGAVMVTEARRTAVGAVQKAKDLLIRNQTRLFGVVVNKFQERDATSGYGYGYGYGLSADEELTLPGLGFSGDEVITESAEPPARPTGAKRRTNAATNGSVH